MTQEQKINKIYDAICGDEFQPGLIKKSNITDKRLTKLEGKWLWLSGIVVGCNAAAAAVIGYLKLK